MLANGQQSGRQKECEAKRRGSGEGPSQAVGQDADRAGQLRLEGSKLTADGSVLANLTPPTVPAFGLGQAGVSPLEYTGHRSLLVRGTGSVKSPSFLQGGSLFGQLLRKLGTSRAKESTFLV